MEPEVGEKYLLSAPKADLDEMSGSLVEVQAIEEHDFRGKEIQIERLKCYGFNSEANNEVLCVNTEQDLAWYPAETIHRTTDLPIEQGKKVIDWSIDKAAEYQPVREGVVLETLSIEKDPKGVHHELRVAWEEQ